MDWLSLIFAILAAIGSLSSYTMYILAKVKGAAAGAIEHAEEAGKSGKEKFDNAVNSVYVLVPPALRTFISRNLIEKIVQATFDKVEEYARKQKKT